MTETKVWIVFHGDDEPNSRCELKIVGIFSSQLLPENAIVASRELPGFRSWPDLFHIDTYRLDEKHWAEGFGADSL